MTKALQIHVKGIKQVQKMMAQLPAALNEEMTRQGDTFMRSTQKSAKLRAPRWTGKLAQSIRFFKIKNQMRIVVESPYGIFQEFGFRPHYVQLGRSTRSGFAVADWAASQGVRDWKGSIFVSKYKPFIMPALEINIAKLPMMLSTGAKKAINKARR